MLLAGPSGDSSPTQPQPPKQGALRRYIENFDRDTLNSMARLVSTEGASLIERQTAALFGDLQKLHQQMQVGSGFCLPVCSVAVAWPASKSRTLDQVLRGVIRRWMPSGGWQLCLHTTSVPALRPAESANVSDVWTLRTGDCGRVCKQQGGAHAEGAASSR